jgi:hypothetical protein
LTYGSIANISCIIVLSLYVYIKKIPVIQLTFECIYPDVVEEPTYILGNDYVSEIQSPGVVIMCPVGLLDLGTDPGGDLRSSMNLYTIAAIMLIIISSLKKRL